MSPVPVGGIVLEARVIVRSGTGFGAVAVILGDYVIGALRQSRVRNTHETL